MQIEHTAHISDAAKQVKLADKISNLRDVPNHPPVGWSVDRKRGFFGWAKRVTDQLRGVHSGLEALFDQAFSERSKAGRRLPVKSLGMGGDNMWFETLTGFKEESPEQVRSNLEVSGSTMTSLVNGRSWSCGSLETPTLAELRSRVAENRISSGQIEIREVIGDAKALHADAGNSGTLFQVASQFNLLEMSHPGLTPEDGVAIYDEDRTQGPAYRSSPGHPGHVGWLQPSSPRHIVPPCLWAI